MAVQKIANIAVRVGADISELQSQMKSAEGVMAKFAKAGRAGMAALATVAVVAAAAVAKLTSEGIRLGDEMLTTSQRLGIAVNEVAALRHAARYANVEAATLEQGMARLGVAVAKAAEGSKQQAQALGLLGLKAEDLQKLSLTEQMLAVGDAIDKQTDATKKLNAANDIFGRGAGRQFIAVFKDGADAVREQMAAAKDYGLFLDGAQSEVIERAADAQDSLKSAYEGLALQIGATFAPAVAAASESLAGWSQSIVAALPGMQSFAEQVFGIAAAATDLSDAALQKSLIDNVNALTEVENRLADQRRTLSADQLAMDGEHQILLQQQADTQARINELIAERAQRGAGTAPAIAPVDEDAGGFDLDQQGKDAAAEVELLAAVAEERDRLSALEAQQEFDWATTMAEEREAAYAAELEQLQTWETTLAEERDKYTAAELDAMVAKEGILTEAARAGAAQRAEYEKQSAGQRVQTVLSSLTAMTAGIAQHSKKAFQLNKLLAVADAVINTARGVTQALAAYPPPISFAMAAAQAAAGAAQISAIKNTQFEGGGRGTTPSAAATPVVNDQPVTQTVNRRLTVEGLTPGAIFSGDAMRDFAQKLIDFQRDGGEVVLR